MRRRVSKEAIDAKRKALAVAKEQRERFQLLLEGKDSPFWKEIGGRLESKAKMVESQLDGYVDMPEREVFAALECRRMLRFFKDMVDEAENTVLMLDKRIGKLEEEIGEMREGGID